MIQCLINRGFSLETAFILKAKALMFPAIFYLCCGQSWGASSPRPSAPSSGVKQLKWSSNGRVRSAAPPVFPKQRGLVGDNDLLGGDTTRPCLHLVNPTAQPEGEDLEVIRGILNVVGFECCVLYLQISVSCKYILRYLIMQSTADTRQVYIATVKSVYFSIAFVFDQGPHEKTRCPDVRHTNTGATLM